MINSIELDVSMPAFIKELIKRDCIKANMYGLTDSWKRILPNTCPPPLALLLPFLASADLSSSAVAECRDGGPAAA